MSDSGASWKGEGRPPRKVGIPIRNGGDDIPLGPHGPRIWSRWRTGETGVLEVNFVFRAPYATRLNPDLPEVMQIFASCRDHVESVPVFVTGSPRWRYGVCVLSSKVSRVQTLLLAPRTQCGCDTWLDSGTSREVYEALREWLKRSD